jgi:hypothetical protein
MGMTPSPSGECIKGEDSLIKIENAVAFGDQLVHMLFQIFYLAFVGL